LEYKGNKYLFITIEGDYYSLLRVQKTRKDWEFIHYETNFNPSQGTPTHPLSQLKQKAIDNKWLQDSCYLVLPRHEITSRIVTFPSQNIDEIKNMVALSAEEYVPYSSDEIQTSQMILEQLPNDESKVFIAIAHRDLIDEKINILREIGLEPLGILVSTGLIADTAIPLAKDKLHTGNIGIVHLALGGIEFAIFHNNRLQFSRGVRTTWELREHKETTTIPEKKDEDIVLDPFRIHSEPLVEHSQQTTKAQSELATDLTQEIVREIRTSVNTYQQETESEFTINKIYISADFPVPQHLKDELQKFLDIPCVLISPEHITGCSWKTEWAPPISAPLVGVALSLFDNKPTPLNLLPEKLLITQKVREIAKHIKRLAVLGIVLILSLVGLFAQSVYQRQKLIHELQRQVAEIESNARGVAEKRQQLQILRREVAKNGSALDCLSRITASTPPRVNMNMYSYRRNEGINIWGRAKSVDDVHAFAENLRRQAISSSLSAFQQARSVYEQQTREQNEVIFDYQISIPFSEEEESRGADTATNP